MAPGVGVEPTTLILTVSCSATELPRNAKTEQNLKSRFLAPGVQLSLHRTYRRFSVFINSKNVNFSLHFSLMRTIIILEIVLSRKTPRSLLRSERDALIRSSVSALLRGLRGSVWCQQ